MSQVHAPPDTRSLAAKVIIWLLLVEALALLALGILSFLNLGMFVNFIPATPESIFVENLTSGIIFVGLGCLGLVVTVYFLRLSRMAWTIGMLLQGLLLFTALVIYFDQSFALYTYPMMAYGTLMVIYLHLPEIIGTFAQPDEAPENQ